MQDLDAQSGDGDGGDQGVNEQRVAEDRSVADESREERSPDAAVVADPDGLRPPDAHAVPRPRARGTRHPPVPTRAQVERHALEQHVNYAAWCAHCV